MTETPPASLLGFEYQALIDDISKKSIGFQTTIPKDCELSDLNALLDKCRLAVDRQRVFAQIEAKSIDLRNLEETLDRVQRDISAQDKEFARRAEEHDGRAARGLSTAEQKERQAKITGFQHAAEARDQLIDRLAKLRAMVSSEQCP